MGSFLDYKSNIFSGLEKVPQTIVAATENNIWVNAIILTNLGEEEIRVNLQLTRTFTSGSPLTIYLAYNFPIPSYKSPRKFGEKTLVNTVELVEFLGIRKNLEHTNSFSDSLKCFSNGYTQIFDCSVDYAALKELPI